MPIENNAVLWPTRLSPRIPVATLRIPKQTFDYPDQLDFASIRGTACRTTDRSATRAARDSGCMTKWLHSGRK